jgi:hypothetical protein
MDQYMKVVFPTRRHVWIDGRAAAWTNRVFQIEAGHHWVSLNPERANFRPDYHEINVTGTLPTDPLVLEFTQKADQP